MAAGALETSYSARFDRALIAAARAHRDQVRKGGDIPYVQHPVHVAFLLARHGFGEDVVVAGLLHDVVEDCDVTLDQIERDFGAGVSGLVASMTELKEDPSGAERPWRVRKTEALARLDRATFDEAALKAADALHNVQSTLSDLRAAEASATGAADVWARFHAPPVDQLWYHREVASRIAARLGSHPLAAALDEAVDSFASYVTS